MDSAIVETQHQHINWLNRVHDDTLEDGVQGCPRIEDFIPTQLQSVRAGLSWRVSTYSFPPEDKGLSLGKTCSMSRNARSPGKSAGRWDLAPLFLWSKRLSKLNSPPTFSNVVRNVATSPEFTPQPRQQTCESTWAVKSIWCISFPVWAFVRETKLLLNATASNRPRLEFSLSPATWRQGQLLNKISLSPLGFHLIWLILARASLLVTPKTFWPLNLKTWTFSSTVAKAIKSMVGQKATWSGFILGCTAFSLKISSMAAGCMISIIFCWDSVDYQNRTISPVFVGNSLTW